MSNEAAPALLAQCVTTVEVIAGLHRALDVAYGRVARAARAQWQQDFAGVSDPSDAIVSVRITSAAQAQTQRGSAFLPQRARSHRATMRKLTTPRFAD